MKTLRVSMIALALCAMVAVRALADDNWLLGTWVGSAGYSYTFTAADVTLTGPTSKLGPFGNAKYEVNGDTILVSADGLPGKATVKKTDDTHATLDVGDGNPVSLTKQ